ncbi:MAG: deoxyribose-phosphate aldolase [Ilumatobacter sp.]|nr:deoxyribose-phosphate aldolase [Ilumatobacter sp.]
MTPDRARQAISLVDLTNLSDDCTVEDVVTLCARARRHGTAAVCVWPDFVAQSAAALDGTDVAVATVVNFPTGDERPFAVSVLTERSIDDGADEIDVVLPYRAFVAGDTAPAADVLGAVRAAAADGVLVKVILETGELPDLDSVERAASFAIDHGADFVKTSTGKSPVSATEAAVERMLAAIAHADGTTVGIKPSGGIGTADAAEVYLTLAEQAFGADWISPRTFRFGASSLLGALVAAAGDGDADER